MGASYMTAGIESLPCINQADIADFGSSYIKDFRMGEVIPPCSNPSVVAKRAAIKPN